MRLVIVILAVIFTLLNLFIFDQWANSEPESAIVSFEGTTFELSPGQSLELKPKVTKLRYDRLRQAYEYWHEHAIATDREYLELQEDYNQAVAWADRGFLERSRLEGRAGELLAEIQELTSRAHWLPPRWFESEAELLRFINSVPHLTLKIIINNGNPETQYCNYYAVRLQKLAEKAGFKMETEHLMDEEYFRWYGRHLGPDEGHAICKTLIGNSWYYIDAMTYKPWKGARAK